MKPREFYTLFLLIFFTFYFSGLIGVPDVYPGVNPPNQI